MTHPAQHISIQGVPHEVFLIMGQNYLFECNACGYNAHVSGAKDCGFVAVVQTMTCHNCNELVDVIIGAEGKEGKRVQCRCGKCNV